MCSTIQVRHALQSGRIAFDAECYAAPCKSMSALPHHDLMTFRHLFAPGCACRHDACAGSCVGFGNGDEAAEAALLARLVQERPVRAEHLLSLAGKHDSRPLRLPWPANMEVHAMLYSVSSVVERV